MNSPINYAIDDKDLDDAALWAVIDSTAASISSSVSSKSRKPLAIKHTNHNHYQSPRAKLITSNPSPPNKVPKNHRNHNSSDGEVLQEPGSHHRQQKMARYSCVTELSETTSPPLAMVKHVQRTPTASTYSSPDTRKFELKEYSPIGSDCTPVSYRQCEEREISRHSLAGRFPSVSLFKEYQNAAMAVGGRYHFTSIYLMKLKTKPLSLMRAVMFSVLNSWFEHTCRVVDFQMDGAHVKGVRRDL